MRIGIISDIHGNLPAISAVLKDMPPVELLVCAGDVVGYYPDVNEVCDILRQSEALVVRGNHDAYVTGERQPDPSKLLTYRTEWTREQLTSRNHAWLAGLPVEMRFSIGHARIILRHASLWDEESYLYREAPCTGRVCLEEGEILLVGHTHIPMKLQASHGLLINPGSVGQPRDYDPRASYSTLDTMTGRVEYFRSSYDVVVYQKQLRALGWEDKMIQILSRERKPNDYVACG